MWKKKKAYIHTHVEPFFLTTFLNVYPPLDQKVGHFQLNKNTLTTVFCSGKQANRVEPHKSIRIRGYKTKHVRPQRPITRHWGKRFTLLAHLSHKEGIKKNQKETTQAQKTFFF